MLVLASTSDKIQVALTGAVTTNQFMCFAAYRDTTSSTISPLRNVTLTNGVSQVDLVGSPSASTYRVIEYLSVYNADTVVNEVTVRFYDGATGYRLIVCRLAIGEKLEYQEGIGFRVLSNGYSVKTSTTFDSISNTTSFGMLTLGADVVNAPITANATLEIPALAMPVKKAKKYWFRHMFFYSADAATTGARFNLYGNASAQGYFYMQYQNSTATTTNSTFGSISTYLATLLSSTSSAATNGNVAVLEGIISPDSDGVIIPVFGCEVASSNNITVKAGTFLQYQQIA
jgi:hypothetical protein